MGWIFLAFLGLMVAVGIATKADLDKKETEEREKRREAVEREKWKEEKKRREASQEEEKQKAIRDEQRRKVQEEAEFYRRTAEKERQAREEMQRQEEEQRKIRAKEYNDELSKIPIIDMQLSDETQDLTNWSDFPSEKLSMINPRTGARKSLYTDFTVVDVETTGLDKYSEIIELSAIKYRNLEPVSAFTTLVKPSGVIPDKIIQLTHIDENMVADAPTINQVMPAFIEYVGDDNLLGHNLSFDLKFLYKSGFDCFAKSRRYYDTLKIARSKLADGLLENHKLTTLCDHYDIYRDDAHRSLSDCYATGKIYKKLLECYVLKSD